MTERDDGAPLGGGLFEGQHIHLGAHLVLAPVAWWLCHRPGIPAAGAALDAWIAAALALPLIHQGWVWLCWRLELHRGALSARFGAERAFRGYAVGFTVLAILRVATVWGVAIADADSLPIPPWAAWAGAAVSLGLSALLMHSVAKHFGFRRAFGIDHFDPSYRGAPLVKGGLFRYVDNAMYTFAPFILLVPVALFRSERGLVLTAFNWLVLWAHYLGTERPDMRRIYGG